MPLLLSAGIAEPYMWRVAMTRLFKGPFKGSLYDFFKLLTGEAESIEIRPELPET